MPKTGYPQYSVSTAEAAEIIGCSPKTLSNWRALGEGPSFVRIGGRGGRIVYRVADLHAFIDARLVTTSSVGSDLATAPHGGDAQHV